MKYKNQIQKVIIVLIAVLLKQAAWAQDIHFSDFYASPLNLNPALTGLFRGNIRVTGLYRDQYRTVSLPYQTIAMGVDFLNRRSIKPRMFGYGLQINYDVAGSTRFSSTQLIMPLAFHIPLDREKLILSIGLSPAIHFYSLNQTGMQLPNQFIDDRFVESQTFDENFAQMNARIFDLGAGINLKIVPKIKYSYSIGFALHNINQPNLSFFDKNNNNIIQQRFVAHFQLRRQIVPTINLLPELRWQKQSTQQEWQFGIKAIHSIDNLIIPFYEYGIGMRSRSRDAVIAHLGCTYRDFLISLNYDLNISKLQAASNFHGAFEIAVIYIYNRANYPRKSKFIKCPTHL